jgi:hypothetical protein
LPAAGHRSTSRDGGDGRIAARPEDGGLERISELVHQLGRELDGLRASNCEEITDRP